jgi:hypothetical protein
MANLNSVSHLPVKKNLSSTLTWTIAAAILMAGMSLLGLFFTSSVYSTEEQISSYKPNDLINLVIALPLILGLIRLVRKGRWIGLLFWPGMLMFMVYNYTAMLIGIPFGWPSLAYAAVVLTSAYQLFILLRSIDGAAVQKRLEGAVNERFSGIVLVLFAVGFFFLAVGVIQQAAAGESISRPEVGVSAADMVLSVLLLVGGILFFLRKPLGYTAGPGMLFVSMVLFIAVILFVVIQPFLLGTSFSWNDLVVLGSMAIVCLIPFLLMTRGILAHDRGNREAIH